VLIAAAVSTHAATPGHGLLARSVIERGLAKAECPIAPKDARIVGSEWLGRRLRIVQVTCRRGAGAHDSILFAVPVHRPRRGRLIAIQDWRDGHAVSGYRVVSPGYDRKTRTMNSIRDARSAGDCGTIKEWQWTGWSFRLIHVWRKPVCDGERFDWERRADWQVYPVRRLSTGP
jgi:hypothetical protein